MNLNTVEFYDAYWGGPACQAYLADRQLDEIAAEIVRRIGPACQRIMDIGGGVSRIARLAKAAGHAPLVVDFSRAALDIMRSEGIDTLLLDIRRWDGLPLRSVDVVTCTEVLEHLRRPLVAVRMAAAHAPRAFFTVPDRCMGPEEVPTHLRTFTADSLRELLSGCWAQVNIETMYRWLVAEVRDPWIS